MEMLQVRLNSTNLRSFDQGEPNDWKTFISRSSKYFSTVKTLIIINPFSSPASIISQYILLCQNVENLVLNPCSLKFPHEFEIIKNVLAPGKFNSVADASADPQSCPVPRLEHLLLQDSYYATGVPLADNQTLTVVAKLIDAQEMIDTFLSEVTALRSSAGVEILKSFTMRTVRIGLSTIPKKTLINLNCGIPFYVDLLNKELPVRDHFSIPLQD